MTGLISRGTRSKGDRTDLATLRLSYEDMKGGIWQATVWVDILKIGQSSFER